MKKIIFQKEEIIPSKIVCIGRNYVDHIKELDNEMPKDMVIFNKPNSAISNKLEYFSEDTRYEGEICLLIKDNKIDAIAFGLDLTKANEQNYLKSKSLPWERSKSFNGSAVLSEFVKLEDDISKIRLELFINDTLAQYGSYDLMMYKPTQMIEEINSFMTLEDGDVIMTGTPKGVGTYNLNDKFEGKIYIDEKLVLEASWIVT
ncbi:fumarylacetoacetate hydrolase family protein [Arcobacter sp. 15-2]|uniref:fumarylacetoacetate hydrolase family protein n=1 Tax=Arcobacter sp. 15-2 TaxID=3374109 RepID=UPI00399C9857